MSWLGVSLIDIVCGTFNNVIGIVGVEVPSMGDNICQRLDTREDFLFFSTY